MHMPKTHPDAASAIRAGGATLQAVPRRRRQDQVREACSLSRSLEFFSETELQKQTGFGRKLWPAAMLKELIDNALDHCEEIGRLPDVVVKVGSDALMVMDNGAGIPPDTVSGMLDFETRTSSREAYRCPTRGQQGNGGKCFIAMPFVLNGNRGLSIIVACGVRHDIMVGVDVLAQRPEIEHSQTPEKVHSGTFVRLEIDDLPSILGDDGIERIVQICRSYIALNPHLSMTLKLPGGKRMRWERTSDKCRKWSAAEPDPPAWYDNETFGRRVAATFIKDRGRGEDRTLAEFIRQFGGMSRSETRKRVAEEVGLGRARLSDLTTEEGLHQKLVSHLLKSMKKHGVAPKPEKLGAIGRSHIEQMVGPVQYKRVADTCDGLPFVVEAAFAEVGDCCEIVTGCNFSPAVDLPVVRMLDALAEEQMIQEGESEVFLLLHIATVGPNFLDRGKGVMAVDGSLEEAIRSTVVAVTKKYAQRRKREEKDITAYCNRIAREQRGKPDCTLKDAIVQVLPVAIEKAGGGGIVEFSDRDLYYAARKLIQVHTSAPLTQKWFDKVVDDWEVEHGLIAGRLRDPRGFLLEPHTRIKIPLGTKAVESYTIPDYCYDTIIYVEKKGMLSRFEMGQIGEKYDCAIVAAEGYAPRAAKALIHAAQQGHKMKVLCFHDADPHGYNIARTLAEGPESGLVRRVQFRVSGRRRFHLSIRAPLRKTKRPYERRHRREAEDQKQADGLEGRAAGHRRQSPPSEHDTVAGRGGT